jgi:hypothetical protein
MAKQPRQQPIGFYGKFQPTGVDNSAAQRMQALAGLGETVAVYLVLPSSLVLLRLRKRLPSRSVTSC